MKRYYLNRRLGAVNTHEASALGLKPGYWADQIHCPDIILVKDRAEFAIPARSESSDLVGYHYKELGGTRSILIFND